jgi:hypothetical protein
MTLQHFHTLVLLLAAFTACTAPLQGPEADLHAIATPDPVPQVVRPVPQPAPGPTPAQGHFRAWVPPQVQANGDTVEGHWIIVSTTPPAVEVLEPAPPMPRAPHPHLGGKQPAPQAPQVPVSQVPLPTPVLPSGLVAPDGQGMLRVPRVSPLRQTLGGQ